MEPMQFVVGWRGDPWDGWIHGWMMRMVPTYLGTYLPAYLPRYLPTYIPVPRAWDHLMCQSLEPSPYDAVPLISNRWLEADWRLAYWEAG